MFASYLYHKYVKLLKTYITYAYSIQWWMFTNYCIFENAETFKIYEKMNKVNKNTFNSFVIPRV